MVDHVTHHEIEQWKSRRHLELQEFIREQMRNKEQTPPVEQGQKNTSARSHCNSEVGDDPNQHGTETHSEKSKVAAHGSRDGSLVDDGSLTSEQVANSLTVTNQARLVMTVKTITKVTSEDVKFVTVTRIMMTATQDIASDGHL